MNQPVFNVFLADYVPIRNRGEEAILRGIQDMLADHRDVHVTLFGDGDSVQRTADLTVLPQSWLFATRLRRSGRLFWRMLTLVQLRLGLHGRLRRLTCTDRDPYRIIGTQFAGADLVLVGHDGFLCIENCIALMIARRAGKRCGILGAGLSGAQQLGLRTLARPLWKRAMECCDFAVFREASTAAFFRTLAPATDKLMLAPDPAFTMRPASAQAIDAIWRAHPELTASKAAGRPLVAVCVCEKSVVFNGAFVDPPRRTGGWGRLWQRLRRRRHAQRRYQAKRERHAAFVAALLDALAQTRGAHLVFLPHSREDGIGNDVAVARFVAAHMRSPAAARTIMDGDYDARTLKGFVRQADFLVSERTHALIGGISVRTPFLGLTNTRDRRTHEIVGGMCDCHEQLLDMDAPDTDRAIAHLLHVFDQRQALRGKLERLADDIARQLHAAARLVMGGAHA